MKDALDKRGVGGRKFHTNSILEAIKDSEIRMLSRVTDVTGPLLVSEDDSEIGTIVDEEFVLDNVIRGISGDFPSNSEPIQDVSKALVNS